MPTETTTDLKLCEHCEGRGWLGACTGGSSPTSADWRWQDASRRGVAPSVKDQDVSDKTTTGPSIHRGCMLFKRWRALDATWWRKVSLRDRLQFKRDGAKREFLPTRWYRGSAETHG